MRQIGDFIGGILGLLVLGYIVYGVFTTGNSLAITVVVILLIIFIVAITRDDKPKTVIQKKSKAQIPKKTTYDDDYDRFDDRCHHCGGCGWEYYCATCYSRAALEPSTEYYDGDMYCPECSKKGKLDSHIKEEICSVCDGSGKDPDPYYG